MSAKFGLSTIDIRRVNQVQNRFSSFIAYESNIVHPIRNYSIIRKFLKIDSLRRKDFGIRFWRNLFNGRIDAPRLIKILSISIPNGTRFQGTFYLQHFGSNFVRNTPLIRITRDVNLSHTFTWLYYFDPCYCSLFVYHFKSSITTYYLTIVITSHIPSYTYI